jgi:hypothetical protein
VYDLDREFDGLRHEMKVNPIYCYLNIYLKKKHILNQTSLYVLVYFM